MKKADKQLEEQYLKMRDQNIQTNPWIEFRNRADQMFTGTEMGAPLGLWEELKQWMEEQHEMYNDRHEVLVAAYKDIEGAPRQEEDSLNFKIEELDDAITACVEDPEENLLKDMHLKQLEAVVEQVTEVVEELYGQIEEL